MAFIVAVHVPIAGMGLLPVLLGWPLLLFPLHVLVLEFVIDPACTFVFEADEQEESIMDRPPRSTQARLFSASLLRRSFLMGGVILAVAFAVYAGALRSLDEDVARALCFAALIAAVVALIFVNRAPDSSFTRLLRRPNKVFWIIVCAAASVVAAILYVPPLAAAFRFSVPDLRLSLAVLSGAALTVIGLGMLVRHERKVLRPARAGQ
jgi:Ca2+-transporting ATPase